MKYKKQCNRWDHINECPSEGYLIYRTEMDYKIDLRFKQQPTKQYKSRGKYIPAGVNKNVK